MNGAISDFIRIPSLTVSPLGAVHKVLSVNKVGWCVTLPDTVTEFKTTSKTCLVKTSLFPKMLYCKQLDSSQHAEVCRQVEGVVYYTL